MVHTVYILLFITVVTHLCHVQVTSVRVSTVPTSFPSDVKEYAKFQVTTTYGSFGKPMFVGYRLNGKDIYVSSKNIQDETGNVIIYDIKGGQEVQERDDVMHVFFMNITRCVFKEFDRIPLEVTLLNIPPKVHDIISNETYLTLEHSVGSIQSISVGGSVVPCGQRMMHHPESTNIYCRITGSYPELQQVHILVNGRKTNVTVISEKDKRCGLTAIGSATLHQDYGVIYNITCKVGQQMCSVYFGEATWNNDDQTTSTTTPMLTSTMEVTEDIRTIIYPTTNRSLPIHIKQENDVINIALPVLLAVLCVVLFVVLIVPYVLMKNQIVTMPRCRTGESDQREQNKSLYEDMFKDMNYFPVQLSRMSSNNPETDVLLQNDIELTRPGRYLIHGDGVRRCGKTTMCRQLVTRWAQDELTSHLLSSLEVNKPTNLQNERKANDYSALFISADDREADQMFLNYIKRKQYSKKNSRLLIIIDDYDRINMKITPQMLAKMPGQATVIMTANSEIYIDRDTHVYSLHNLVWSEKSDTITYDGSHCVSCDCLEELGKYITKHNYEKYQPVKHLHLVYCDAETVSMVLRMSWKPLDSIVIEKCLFPNIAQNRILSVKKLSINQPSSYNSSILKIIHSSDMNKLELMNIKMNTEEELQHIVTWVTSLPALKKPKLSRVYHSKDIIDEVLVRIMQTFNINTTCQWRILCVMCSTREGVEALTNMIKQNLSQLEELIYLRCKEASYGDEQEQALWQVLLHSKVKKLCLIEENNHCLQEIAANCHRDDLEIVYGYTG